MTCANEPFTAWMKSVLYRVWSGLSHHASVLCFCPLVGCVIASGQRQSVAGGWGSRDPPKTAAGALCQNSDDSIACSNPQQFKCMSRLTSTLGVHVEVKSTLFSYVPLLQGAVGSPLGLYHHQVQGQMVKTSPVWSAVHACRSKYG